MMKLKCFFLFFSGILFSASANARNIDLAYTLSRKDSVTLEIQVCFRGNSNGATTLHLPNEWASQHKLYTCISAITAVSQKTTVVETGKPYNYTIKYPPHSQVIFTYLLHKDWPGRLRYPLYFRPVIQPELFYFEGYSGLVYPELADTSHVRCSLNYKGFAKTDFIGNSFYAGANKGNFTVSMNELLNSIFCAGKFRSKTITINGHHIVMALTGKPAFADDDAFAGISRIILNERSFWNDAGPAYYFTMFMPLYDQGNTGGTAHYHAFSLFQSADLGLSGNLLPMIAHEYFHNWLGLGLKMPEPDEPYKWFSEGFTDYYSYKILLNTGAITADGFLTKINSTLKDYFLSPYFNMPGRELVGRYWENSGLKQMPYYRGLVMAFLLDERISEKGSQSLDDLLRKLYSESGTDMTFKDELFGKLVSSYSDPVTLNALDQVRAGNNEPLTRLLFTSRLYVMDTLKVNKVFDLGFDFNSSKAAGKIVGLRPESNAAKAGLAENMKLNNKFSVWFNNTEKPAMIGVTENGKERFVQYIPVLKADKIIPQIVRTNTRLH